MNKTLTILLVAAAVIGIYAYKILYKGEEAQKVEDRVISSEDIFKWYDFCDKKVLSEWKNKIFKGKTLYWIDAKDSINFLHSESRNTASALYKVIGYNAKDFPIIQWKWRPVKFPDKNSISDPKLLDDYPLRFYVVFASGFFTNFRCVEYVWDDNIKEGTKLVSPYSEKIMQLVVRSGQGKEEWAVEERNIYEDYTALFGEKPKMKVRAIAVMSDSEGTMDSSEGNFKEIKIIKKT